MIDNDYYSNYYGPDLVRCILDGENVTNLVKEKYGVNNWHGKLWTHKEVFGNDCLNKEFRCEFSSDREHWFEGIITDLDDFFNVPLHTPMNQINLSDWIYV